MDILIVEDDRLISLMLARMVEKDDHRVVDIHIDAESAIETVENKKVDLILMDIMLEGKLDGIEAMEIIRDRNLNIRVIYVTGNSDPVTRKRAKKTNYDAFLVKPITFDHLLREIRNGQK